jgi:hypothetical protein
MQRIKEPKTREPSWYVKARQKLFISGNWAFPKCEKYQYAAVDAMTNWQIEIATSQFLE